MLQYIKPTMAIIVLTWVLVQSHHRLWAILLIHVSKLTLRAGRLEIKPEEATPNERSC